VSKSASSLAVAAAVAGWRESIVVAVVVTSMVDRIDLLDDTNCCCSEDCFLVEE